MATLQVRDHALVAGRVRAGAPEAIAEPHVDPVVAADAVQQQLLLLRRQVLPRDVRVDLVLGAHRLEQPVEVLGVTRGPRGDRTVGDRRLGVRDHQFGVDLERRAQPVARRTRSVRTVEREVAGCELLEALAVRRPSQVLGERQQFGLGVVGRDDLDLRDALGQLERRLHGVGEPPVDAVAQYEAIDDHLDGVLFVAGEVDLDRQFERLAVDTHPAEPLRRQVREQLLVGALAATHHRCEHLEAGALGQAQDAVDDLLRGLPHQSLACLRIVRHADAGEEQAQVVVDLGDGPDRRTRVA